MFYKITRCDVMPKIKKFVKKRLSLGFLFNNDSISILVN